MKEAGRWLSWPQLLNNTADSFNMGKRTSAIPSILILCLAYCQVSGAGNRKSRVLSSKPGRYIGNTQKRREALGRLQSERERKVISPTDIDQRTRQRTLLGNEARQVEFHQTGYAPPPPFKVGDIVYHGTHKRYAQEIVRNGLKVQNIINGPDDRVNLVKEGNQVRPAGVAWVTADSKEAMTYAQAHGSEGVVLWKKIHQSDIGHAEASLNQDGVKAGAFNRTTTGWKIHKALTNTAQSVQNEN